ncbi:hypothetical protein WJX75_001962 [Coccomyxa subellipsoidea]|uniref:Uncharacterized protein n=1 Tax=Coccomyxa subellipsoidea TaxID=248742 RepID=A0ABR2YZY7_9CHLO
MADTPRRRSLCSSPDASSTWSYRIRSTLKTRWLSRMNPSTISGASKKKRDRLVQEKLKLQGELGSIVQAQLTSPAGQIFAPPRETVRDVLQHPARN